jgi:endonuclease III
MKISSDCAKHLRTLFNKLVKSPSKADTHEPTDPVAQLVQAILETDAPLDKAKAAMKQIVEEMIDFNELRVTPIAELDELLGQFLPSPTDRSRMIVSTLSWVFTTFDTLDLTFLRESSHTTLREKFTSIPGCSDYARCAMLLMSFGISACPMDEHMVAYLVENEALPEGVNVLEASHFVERQLKAGEVRDFYLRVKAESEKFIGKHPAKTDKPAKVEKIDEKKKSEPAKKPVKPEARDNKETKKPAAKPADKKPAKKKPGGKG